MSNRLGRSIDYITLRKRLRLARTVIHEGGNLTEYARRSGVSVVSASKYLRKHSECCHAALKSAHHGAATHPLRVLDRLRVLSKQKGDKARSAKALGLTYQGVWHFVNRYAPEGIEEALSDYEDAYGAPLLEAVA